jgi:Raf kinase inhibitor-like YbhB/YbcL family protein
MLLIYIILAKKKAFWDILQNFIIRRYNSNMKIESDVFVNNGTISVDYTCNGKGLQPPLKISGVPEKTKSLALIVHDPDAPDPKAPSKEGFTHWVVWNIDPETSVMGKEAAKGAVMGQTGTGKPGWVPPCPPSGIHRYNFQLYALDTILSIPSSTDKNGLLEAMEGHVIENATLTGLYGK